MQPLEMTDIETFLDRVERRHKPENVGFCDNDYDDYAGEREEYPVIIDDGSFADD